MAQTNFETTNNPPMQPPDSQPTKPRVTHAYKFVKQRKLHRHGTAKEGNEKARPRKATRRHGQGRQHNTEQLQSTQAATIRHLSQIKRRNPLQNQVTNHAYEHVTLRILSQPHFLVTFCNASCGWHMRCIVVQGDAWPLLLSPCNTLL